MIVISWENPEVLDAIDDRLNGMVEDVARLHQRVPEQMIEWQTEDMKRRVPNLEETGESWMRAWITRIWPRSRRTDLKTTFNRRRGARAPRPKARFGVRVRAVAGGPRPILRDELFDMLRERMRTLLDSISWTKG
jgi:hypothetical protein